MEFIIIDDSLFDLFTQEKLLLKSGLAKNVRAFSSPQLAVEHLKEHGSRMSETVILLDLQMPGLNGFEFADHFAMLPESVRRRIKLFMISSTVDPNDMARAETNPFIIRLLPKPLDLVLLRSLLTGE
jgi:CheY-like chemotaxis protein